MPLYGPTVPTMLLQCVPPHRRGFVMGLDAGVNTVARTIAPLALGAVLRARGERRTLSCRPVRRIFLGAAFTPHWQGPARAMKAP